MCRHMAYLGPPVAVSRLLLDPPYGLHRQSWAPRAQRHGTVNADGFGLGWYPPGTGAPGAIEARDTRPARYRRAVPLWADPNLPDLARCLYTGALLAAVRDATPGTGQDEAACAPLRAGHLLFSHNGAVADWPGLPDDLRTPLGARELLEMEARSDSALLWALLVRRLSAGESAGAALASVVRATAAVRPGARLNLLLTDGRTIAAVRWGDSLGYRLVPGPDGDGGAGTRGGRVLVASEPPDDDGDWQDVPDGSLLLATHTDVTITPLTPGTTEPAIRPTERTPTP